MSNRPLVSVLQGALLSMSGCSMDVSLRDQEADPAAEEGLLLVVAMLGSQLTVANSRMACALPSPGKAPLVIGVTSKGSTALLQGVQLTVPGNGILVDEGSRLLASKCTVGPGHTDHGIHLANGSQATLRSCTVYGGARGAEVGA